MAALIPRTFHRVWFDAEDDPIPEEYQTYWKRLQELHPGWEFKSWERRDELTPFLRNRELFESFPEGVRSSYGFRSDVARYEILLRFGGVYLDTDVEPLRPFDDLLKDDRPFAGWENDRLICPTVMGAPPGHPAIKVLVDELPAWAALDSHESPSDRTGPGFLTPLWRYRDDVRRLPVATFYPAGWWEKDLLGKIDYLPQTLAEHKWHAGWKG